MTRPRCAKPMAHAWRTRTGVGRRTPCATLKGGGALAHDTRPYATAPGARWRTDEQLNLLTQPEADGQDFDSWIRNLPRTPPGGEPRQKRRQENH
jgi:hypothetical protein